jgi:predicted SnoaL-like aldol condensation-catalyzing enzyme
MQIMRLAVYALFITLLSALICAAADAPQPATCNSNPARLDANKQLVLRFFSFKGSLESQAETFLSKDYIQHNPRLLRLDEITGASGRDAWLRAIQEAQKRGIEFEIPGIRYANPIILMAECDLVTALYERRLEDPDRPGRTYEAFTFETFRVRDGKLVEHWDQVSSSKGWMK